MSCIYVNKLADIDLTVLEKLVKQRRESATAFESAGRQELAAREQAEIVVLQRFLPVPLSEDELAALISAAIAEAGATSARDMGKVMNLLRPMVAGRADVGALSQLVKTRLAS